MKKLLVTLLFLGAVLLQSYATTSIKDGQKEELLQITTELKNLNDEQLTIIENSQKKNEELQTLCERQQSTINELKSLSESKQEIISEQEKTIEKLQSSSKEPKKSSLLTLINTVMAAIVSFCGGFLVGILFL